MAKNKNILLVDDELDILKLLTISINRMGFNCITAPNVTEAFKKIDNEEFALCLTDMKLPDGSGLQVIEHIQRTKPELPVAMITAYGSLDTGLEAMKAGAFDYIPKPVDLKTLKKLIQAALKKQPAVTSEAQPQEHPQFDMIGDSVPMHELNQHIDKLAKNQAPVFIHGESGSGKELVARMIHSRSKRFDGPFIAVNCGAIPTELMESEFFGHQKGAFTGANFDKQGLFQAAEGGTLFLDEVADLPLNMQVKLLRTLQEKTVRAVGATHEENIDVRILSASHKNLDTEIQANRFREDLFYRINVIELHVPSLRERPEDIKPLAIHLLEKICDKYELAPITLSEEALAALSQHPFPGNVRELENMLERAITLCENQTVDLHDLQFGRQNRLAKSSETEISTEQEATSKPSSSPDAIHIEEALGQFDDFMEDIERKVITMALEKTRWNKTQAAELLGVSFRTLRYKVTKLAIK